MACTSFGRFVSNSLLQERSEALVGVARFLAHVKFLLLIRLIEHIFFRKMACILYEKWIVVLLHFKDYGFTEEHV